MNVIHNSGPSINLLSVTLAKNTILTCILYIEWMGKGEGVNMIQEKKHKFTNKGTKSLFLKSWIFFEAPKHSFSLLEDKIGKTLLRV